MQKPQRSRLPVITFLLLGDLLFSIDFLRSSLDYVPAIFRERVAHLESLFGVMLGGHFFLAQAFDVLVEEMEEATLPEDAVLRLENPVVFVGI